MLKGQETLWQPIQANEVLIPSHFSEEGWVFGAFDNEDFADKSSISGKDSKHFTSQVLYQETTAPPKTKPLVSRTGLSKSTKPCSCG